MKFDRQLIYNKYNGHCAYCGENIMISQMEVDHIIPKSNFNHHIMNKHNVLGTIIPKFLEHLTLKDLNHIDNLNPSCRVCNRFKDSFHLEQFRYELGEQVNRLERNTSGFRRALRYRLIKKTLKPIIFYFELIKVS